MSYSPDQHPTELLPWQANGTLEGEEREAVEAHVAACAECAVELKLLRNLHTTIQATPQPDGGELGLQRLLRDARKESRGRPRWLVPAALAASLAIVVQGVMLLQPGTQEPVYSPLSGQPAAAGLLQVEFVSEARAVELQKLLHDAGVRIVDGPSAAGLYRLAVEPGRDPQRVMEQLRSHKNLIRHVALEQ